MPKIRCKPCGGSGRVMGGGMMLADCETCDGAGKIYVDEPVPKKVDIKIDRSNKHYKDAIKKIKALGKDITDEKAETIFAEELKNINNSEIKTVY
jgi:hypothetical protein